MIEINKFKDLKNILPQDMSSKQRNHLKKWFSLATKLDLTVSFEDHLLYFEKDFGNDVQFEVAHHLEDYINKIHFDFNFLLVRGLPTKLPLQGIKFEDGKYIIQPIENPVQLAQLAQNCPIAQTFQYKDALWQGLIKTPAFKLLEIERYKIYMCIDSSIGFNVGTIIDTTAVYGTYGLWYNPPQNEEGAKRLLNLLCENYGYSLKYVGDVSKLTEKEVHRLYETETAYLSCQSNGHFCSIGCTHTCLNDDKKYMKTQTKNVLLSLIKEYKKIENENLHKPV